MTRLNINYTAVSYLGGDTTITLGTASSMTETGSAGGDGDVYPIQEANTNPVAQVKQAITAPSSGANKCAVLVGVSDTLAAQRLSLSSADVVYMQRQPNNTTPQDLYAGVYIYVYRPSTGAILGVLWDDGSDKPAFDAQGYANVIPPGGANDFYWRQMAVGQNAGIVDCLDGDRIVVEFWMDRHTGGHTAPFFFGGNQDYDPTNTRIDWIAIGGNAYPASHILLESAIYDDIYWEGETVPIITATGGAFVAEHARVRVKDSGGTWRDLTSYPGFNAFKSARWQADIDNPMATASVTLKRELEGLSLAPLMETSAANLEFDPSGTYAPLIDVGREIKIDVAIVPMDLQPLAADWVTKFHGYIDVVDAAASDFYVELSCRDLGAKLADTFIERERFYSLATVSGTPVAIRVFEPFTDYALGEYVVPSDAALNGYFYEVTTAGTSGSSDPTWPTGVGSTVSSGSVTFTRRSSTADSGAQLELIIQAILDDNDTGVTLYAPVTADWAVKGFIQQREPVLDAVRALATQNGWDIRYNWRADTEQFELTLYEPDRAKTDVDYSFSASDYKTIGRGAMDISRVRNACRVIYSDTADKNPDGSYKRKFEEYEDGASVGRFGRRFMEIAESDTSNIDTSAEALRLATAAIEDLKDPLIDLEVQTAVGFPYVELGHLYSFTPNSRHFSSTQTIAVCGFSHVADSGRLKSTIVCRGRPAGRYTSWFEIVNHPTSKPGRLLVGPQTGTAGPHAVYTKIDKVKEATQNVATPSPVTITLENSWVPYASGGTTPRYWRDANGVVHISGAMEGGTASGGTRFAGLPAGFRPAEDTYFLSACAAPTKYARIAVNANGDMFAIDASTTFTYLDGITFRTDV